MIEFQPKELDKFQRIEFAKKHKLTPEEADEYRELVLEALESVDSFLKYARYSRSDVLEIMQVPENIELFDKVICNDIDQLGAPQLSPAEIITKDLETICAYQAYLVGYLESRHNLRFFSRQED